MRLLSGTIENIVAIEDAGIRASVPLTDFAHRSDLYGRDTFSYDRHRDHYSCPQGHVLPLACSKRTEEVVVYRGDPVIYTASPLKTKCTTSDRGRSIQRSISERYLETVRSYHATEAYQKAIRKRQVWVEPLFAEAKEWHGLRRFRLRGLEKVNGEALLIASGQNLKRLLSRWGWGRRPFPSGVAGVVLPTLQPLPPLPALTP
jgi:Transposase DDE domain